jgi:hypothetical protein
MTHPSKRKGGGFELEVVRNLQDQRLAAEKMAAVRCTGYGTQELLSGEAASTTVAWP